MKKLWEIMPWPLKGLMFTLILLLVLLISGVRGNLLILVFFIALMFAYLNEGVMRKKIDK